MKRHNSAVTTLLVGRIITEDGGRTFQLKVWCPHCKSHHIHGWDDKKAKNDVEHRVAHCFEGPLRAKGYFIGREDGRTDHAF